MAKKYEAGVWEQNTGFVPWSRHSTEAAAKSRARKYAAQRIAPTGGALSWSGGVRRPDGTVYWLTAHDSESP